MSPRPRNTTDQRARIVAAVCTVVATKGYAGGTVAEISKTAKVSTRTFYELFDDRCAAFDAALEYAGGGLFAEVEQACRGSTSFPEAVVASLRALLAYVADNQAAAAVCLVDVLAAQPTAIARRGRAMGMLAAGLDHAALRDPRVESSPTMGAEVAIGGVANVIYDRLTRGRADELPELLPDLTLSVLAVYLDIATATTLTATLAGSPTPSPEAAAQ